MLTRLGKTTWYTQFELLNKILIVFLALLLFYNWNVLSVIFSCYVATLVISFQFE